MAFYVGHNTTFTRLLQITQPEPKTILWDETFIEDVDLVTGSLEGALKFNDEAYMFKKLLKYGFRNYPIKIVPRWGARVWQLDYLRNENFSNLQNYIDMHFSPWKMAEIKTKEGIDLFPQIIKLGKLIHQHILSPQEYVGARCVFKIDPATNTGIKRYITKDFCDFAYWAQQKAYNVQAAPKPLERIDDLTFRTELADTKSIATRFAEKTYFNDIFPDLHIKLKDMLVKKHKKSIFFSENL